MTHSPCLDIDFSDLKHTSTTFRNAEYEHCTFTNCDFSKSSFLSCTFTNCTFTDCNLKIVKLDHSQLDTCSFYNCAVLGVNFSACSNFLFSVSFDKCLLNYSVFTGKTIAETYFTDCSLNEVDFSECNLAQANFQYSDCLRAVFKNTNLSGADFSLAKNYRIDPEENRLQKAKFSWPEVQGLLSKYDLVFE